jgi:hypothetical protein
VRATAELDADLTELVGLLVGNWSSDMSLNHGTKTLLPLLAADFGALPEAVLVELPELRRAVHPAPAWRPR